MSTSCEKWQWIQDLTQKEPPISNLENDEFLDGEPTKEQEAQYGLWGKIANGFEWMREEERVGRWLGLLLAIAFWGMCFIMYYQAHPIQSSHSDDAEVMQQDAHDTYENNLTH